MNQRAARFAGFDRAGLGIPLSRIPHLTLPISNRSGFWRTTGIRTFAE